MQDLGKPVADRVDCAEERIEQRHFFVNLIGTRFAGLAIFLLRYDRSNANLVPFPHPTKRAPPVLTLRRARPKLPQTPLFPYRLTEVHRHRQCQQETSQGNREATIVILKNRGSPGRALRHVPTETPRDETPR